MAKAKPRNPLNAPRKFWALDATGQVIAEGELNHTNTMKMAKYVMNRYPGTVKVKIRTEYIPENHPRGLDHDFRTFVK